MTDRRPYDAVDHDARDEGHAVDRAVERRLPMKRLRRQIRRATRALEDTLGDRGHFWLRVEELIEALRAHREAAYFDIGYEHGVAAGRAEAMRALAETAIAGRDAHKARTFADAIRDQAVQIDLPAPLVVAALLETAWALALGLSDQPATRNDWRKRR